MFNILLDPLPEEFEGFPINSDFRIGIQLQQAIEDPELCESERAFVCAELLFGTDDGMPDISADVLQRGLEFFLAGWYTDNKDERDRADDDDEEEEEDDTPPVMDWDRDAPRIYAAFLQQYRIDLNREKMHYWAFRYLLGCLEECAFRRVMEVREKRITAQMSPEERAFYRQQKARYSLEDKITAAQRKQREEDAIAKEAFLKAFTT